MPLTRRLAVPLAALALVLGASRAAVAACNVTSIPRPGEPTCSAAPFLAPSSGCCGATTCTIDGTVTLSGSTCDLDFGARSVTLSGSLVVGSRTLTLEAGALTVTGLLDASGRSPKPGGNVTLTLGAGGLTLARGAGTAIDLEGFAAGGGTLTAVVGGPVSLSGGGIDASALEPAASGGTITLRQTAGSTPMTVGVPIRADAGTDGVGGTITLQTATDLQVTDTGRITAQGGVVYGGSIELDALSGKVTVAGTAVIRAMGLNGTVGGADGGDISITAGSVEIDGTLDAGGGTDPTGDDGGAGGTIEIEALTGALALAPGGQGLIADSAPGNDGGEVDLITDSPASGVLTIGALVSAKGRGGNNGGAGGGGLLDFASANALTLAQSLDVSGGGGSTGVVSLIAARDAAINSPIDGRDPAGQGEVDIIVGHDLTFTGHSIRVNATVDGQGGTITALAGNDLTSSGFVLDTSGAGTGAGSLIALGAGHNLSIDRTSTLDAKSEQGSGAPGGTITLTAGTPNLPGNLQVDGMVLATGHATGAVSSPASIVLSGCQVTVSGTGVVDSSGDLNARNQVTGRTAITINGKLLTTATGKGGSNTANYPVATPPTLTGSTVSPPFALVAEPLCTAPDTPAGCLVPCPACGNRTAEFPEQCDPPGCPTCDLHCRTLLPAGCVDANPCTANDCDPVFGCVNEPLADGSACNDANPCTTADTCVSGVCAGGPPPDCDDGDPCTDDACDPHTGCTHTPVVCPDDGDACNGAETCTPPVGCHHGTLVTCPAGQVCVPATGECNPKPCVADADCNDGNPCTADACASGFCTTTAITSDRGASAPGCTDSDACNGTETCQAGVCMPGMPPDCDDGNTCTDDSCDSIQGCVHTPIACCCRTPNDCPGSQTCASCVGNVCGVIADCCDIDADCQGRRPCQTGTCVTATHRCQYANAADGLDCGGFCQPASCQGGSCVPGTPLSCPPDADVCTQDFCDPSSGCVHQPIAGCCHDDGECDDHDNCTRDLCDPATHVCSNTRIDPSVECTSCSVDTDCDVIGRCAGKACGPAGVCIAVTALDCDDRQPDFCGLCSLDGAGQPRCTYRCLTDQACDDGNLCTDDKCNRGIGCANTCTNSPKTGFDAVTCRLDTMDAAIHGASAPDLAPSAAAKLGKAIGRARAKLAAAEAAGHGKPALKALRRAARQLKAIPTIVRAAQRKRRIAATLATAILQAASGGSQALSALMASLSL